MLNYVGRNIFEVINDEEYKSGFFNDYGTMDYIIYRNIFDVPEDEWVSGISRVTFEVRNGIITHQIENI